LAATPAESDSATSNRKALHLFNGALSIDLANKLDETTVFADRDFDLKRRERG
jgi:hypothetical protein